MKVGDKVRTIGFFAGIEGVVTEVSIGHDVEDHGGIEIRVTKSSGEQSWIEIGSLEHFVHFGWEKHLQILP
jgi:hypothetical protein